MSEQKQYMSEAAKVRDMPQLMKYVTGRIADVGAGHDKITPDAIAFDGRSLDGVNVVREGCMLDNTWFDAVFSSHFLEHTPSPFEYIMDWYSHLNPGGHIVIYMPDKAHYNSTENLEHLWNWSYEDFLFWFKRTFCGEGKNYRGEHIPKLFELIDSGMDVGDDRYSFYLIARKV